MILGYILQILGIFVLSLAVFYLFQKVKALVRMHSSQKALLEELLLLVPYTTPEKDAQLREVYKKNTKALEIINNTPKNEAVVLHSVASIEKIFGNDERKDVVTLDRREQISQHLKFKQARRQGLIPQKTAKILSIEKQAEAK